MPISMRSFFDEVFVESHAVARIAEEVVYRPSV